MSNQLWFRIGEGPWHKDEGNSPRHDDDYTPIYIYEEQEKAFFEDLKEGKELLVSACGAVDESDFLTADIEGVEIAKETPVIGVCKRCYCNE